MELDKSITHIKSILPIVGIAVFIYILYDIGYTGIIDSISKIDYIFLFIAIWFFFPRILLSTYKWKLITQEQNINIKFITLIKINMIGIFYGTITPLWLGDYIRIPLLQEETGESFGKCASTVLIDQALELFALLLLALGGTLVLLQVHMILFLALFLVFIMLLATSIFFMDKKRSKRPFIWAYKFCIPKKFKAFMAQEFHSFYDHMPSVHFLLWPLLLEIISYLLFFTQIFILALSFPIDISYFSFILIYPIASLIGLIPITISGFGTREGTLIQLFASYGIPSDTTVAISLVGYFVTILCPSFFGGFLSLLQYKRKTSEQWKKKN